MFKMLECEKLSFVAEILDIKSITSRCTFED